MADDYVETTTTYCSTCKQDVPSANYEMHSIHCRRFLTPCPYCGESVNKQQLQEHIDEDHTQVKCDICKDSVEKLELEIHKTSACRLRNVNCPYCEITLPACDIDEHKELCGSRTEECENCRRRILIKDFENHIGSSECETPSAKKIECKNIVPERLIPGRQEGSGSGLGGAEFPLHPQFQPLYSSDVPFNPYFPPRAVSISVPKTNTESKSTASLAKNGLRFSHQNEHGKPSSSNVSSKGRVETHHSGINHRELPFENATSLNSYSEVDNFEEKKPFPDLTDNTFLPCEFCDELLPADSLGFHQATCENVPSTPRSGSPPNFKGLSLDSLPSRVESFKPYQDEAAAVSSNDFPFPSGTPDIGEGSAPCEFCFSSYPLMSLAVHQITCSQNPNLQKPDTPDYTTPTPRLHKADIREGKSEQPKSQPSQVEAPTSDPARRPPDVETKATKLTHLNAKEKRTLAPNFSNETQESTSKLSASLPRNKSTLNNPGSEDGKPLGQRKNKRKSKPISKPANPRVFHEVNALGSDRHRENGSISMHGNPLVPQFPYRSESLLNHSSRFPSHSSHSSPNHSSRFSSRFPSRISLCHSSRFPGPRQMSTRGKNHMRGQYLKRGDSTHGSTRGQDFARGHSTRGRSYGSRTVTIQARPYNARARPVNMLRQTSGIHGMERDVSAETDLNLHGQTVNRAHDVTRPSFRGPGHRLGSGESSATWNRPFYPPRKNSLD